MRERWKSLNTLRNQIFIGFFFVMVIMIGVTGAFIYNRVSYVLKNNAEGHIQQTAVQANGRLDALIGQIDSLTEQVANQQAVQQLLLEELNGRKVTFNQRQSLLQIMFSYQAYMPSVGSLELYAADGGLLFPLREGTLDSRIASSHIAEANRQKGRLVWIGVDPDDPQSLLAIRQVSLLDRWFSRGGYLIARVQRSYFQFNEPVSGSSGRESILLVDKEGQLVGSGRFPAGDLLSLLHSKGQTVEFMGQEYVKVEQYSDRTNWMLLVLTPVGFVTEGLSILKTIMWISGVIGTLLFLMMSFFLSTMITRPISRLIRAMRKFRPGAPGLQPESPAAVELKELNHTYNRMITDINELIRVVYEKEVLRSRIELKALQAQIHPHFLFNTLEAFNWSLQEKGEEELAGLMVSLSRLFRYTIDNQGRDEWVTLREETEHIRRYFQIMEMRLGDRLSWRIELPPELAVVPVPKLLIQPVVENAILHGVESRRGDGVVEVRIVHSVRQGWARVTVADNGPGMDQERCEALYKALQGGPAVSGKGTGMGLANVQQRLKLYYAEADEKVEGLHIVSRSGEGTAVSFEIPDTKGGD
ncbi:sensor histidine kinase [Paenibacillus sp. P96]|uniref:histidine kinase n=1 Tax=Paenibacillus zeirhizosphaerae TaxID=2987519 RepID=A0ABT9FML7_9BACL|nr:sensor histidine kinase [Paenibacillus sp. P96]MDP4095840.1 sensor histidine kinase [Paenibacillus sp. P96]